MSTPRPVVPDDDERDAFLESGGTDVMSFPTESRSEPPHSMAVSYGYDATFFFRLVPDALTGRGEADT